MPTTMDITLGSLIALSSVILNQLLNWGKSKLNEGKEEERRARIAKEVEDLKVELKQQSEKLETKLAKEIDSVKEDVSGHIEELHGRITRTQKESSESGREISRGISELLQRSAKIEGSIETMQKMFEIMQAGKK